jgi:hypothetical protein
LGLNLKNSPLPKASLLGKSLSLKERDFREPLLFFKRRDFGMSFLVILSIIFFKPDTHQNI